MDSYLEYKSVINALCKLSYFENVRCVRYVSYIREIVESVVGVEYLRKDNKKNVDFIINKKNFDYHSGKKSDKIKVKHLLSRLNDNNELGFLIDHNKDVDTFLLSAFDKYFYPQYLWLVDAKELFISSNMSQFNPEASSVKFRFICENCHEGCNDVYVWNRVNICEKCYKMPKWKLKKRKWSLKRYNNIVRQFQDRAYLVVKDEDICYMRKFELTEKLMQLKNLMGTGFHKPNFANRSLAQSLLLEKQRDILELSGNRDKRSLKSIAEAAIELELGPKNKDETISVLLRRKFNQIENFDQRYDNVYNLIIEKQTNWEVKTGEKLGIKDIINEAVINGIEKVI